MKLPSKTIDKGDNFGCPPCCEPSCFLEGTFILIGDGSEDKKITK